MVRKRRKKQDYRLISTLSVAFILIIAIIISNPDILKSREVAAEVNGEAILLSEINEQYDSLPEEYTSSVTKEAILQNAIEMVLLRQEAEAQGITISNEQFNALLDQAMAQEEITREELESTLKAQGRTIEDIKTQFIIKTLIDHAISESDEIGKQLAIQKYVESLIQKADIQIYLK
ncbi:SurA N-terminal domain-containing protein [Nanoarchaeota archaeon]